jgi:hypothetical protein
MRSVRQWLFEARVSQDGEGHTGGFVGRVLVRSCHIHGFEWLLEVEVLSTQKDREAVEAGRRSELM